MKQKSAEARVVVLDRVRVSKVSDSRSSDLRRGNPRPCDGSSVGDQPFREHGPLIIPKLHDPVCSRKSAEGLNKQRTSLRGTRQTTRQRELFHVRTCRGAPPRFPPAPRTCQRSVGIFLFLTSHSRCFGECLGNSS
jgi:hypothetical protein